ncbi:MAG: 7,8-didemethyl-8-hydroxy-5-deazariboflavin synthase subunit CofH [Thaumarchaeota archaeon]|nr:7,8-didemethyl-8-hydroxy-5-deazariboflavin synthase subunit CofH [Nitrososphaerota archaeon]|tara:strand:+ start:179 stop:1420 length:1242 start_codon:yes stop_codon:yes gene_type:complete
MNNFSKIDPVIADILNRALDDKELSVKDAVELFECSDSELNSLIIVADKLRKRNVDDLVTFVVNRNVNFTNVCIKHCGFCAFSRDFREEEGYFLPVEEIVKRTKEAWKLGATEVCIQAGLPPKMNGYMYIDICKAIKRELPKIHIHGFSPEEILYGAVRSETNVEDYLKMLKEAGVGSLPGTAAEILDQDMRDKISPGRITVQDWIHVIKTAHRLGISSTSTIMYGHIEKPIHRANHLVLLREIQKETHGFTEFVPLSFIYTEAPMFKHKLFDDITAGPTKNEVIKMHAIARLMLNNYINNIQVSWVKEGIEFSQFLLSAGVNDFGGTLINESISTAAGAQNGQLLKPRQIRDIIRRAGKIPAQRTSTYKIMKVYGDEESDEPLDKVNDVTIFGSYRQLTKLDKYRFKSLTRN